MKTVGVEGKSIFVNDTLFTKSPSLGEARYTAVLLHRLKSLPPKQCEAAIREAVSASLDSAKIRDRWEEYQKRSALLRRLAAILFVYLFAIAPLLLWNYGFRYVGFGVATGLIAQTFTIGWLFRQAHKHLFPDGSEERFTPFLTMLLAPPAAIRAPDILGRHLLEEFHPLAVAQALAPPETFKALARHILLDLQYPILPATPSSDPAAIRTEEWFRGMVRESIGRFVEHAGASPEELLKPPAPTEIGSRAFCPRCSTQFVNTDAVCGECGGRALVSFGSAG
jgi:hypothetical protein